MKYLKTYEGFGFDLDDSGAYGILKERPDILKFLSEEVGTESEPLIKFGLDYPSNSDGSRDGQLTWTRGSSEDVYFYGKDKKNIIFQHALRYDFDIPPKPFKGDNSVWVPYSFWGKLRDKMNTGDENEDFESALSVMEFHIRTHYDIKIDSFYFKAHTGELLRSGRKFRHPTDKSLDNFYYLDWLVSGKEGIPANPLPTKESWLQESLGFDIDDHEGHEILKSLDSEQQEIIFQHLEKFDELIEMEVSNQYRYFFHPLWKSLYAIFDPGSKTLRIDREIYSDISAHINWKKSDSGVYVDSGFRSRGGKNVSKIIGWYFGAKFGIEIGDVIRTSVQGAWRRREMTFGGVYNVMKNDFSMPYSEYKEIMKTLLGPSSNESLKIFNESSETGLGFDMDDTYEGVDYLMKHPNVEEVLSYLENSLGTKEKPIPVLTPSRKGSAILKDLTPDKGDIRGRRNQIRFVYYYNSENLLVSLTVYKTLAKKLGLEYSKTVFWNEFGNSHQRGTRVNKNEKTGIIIEDILTWYLDLNYGYTLKGVSWASMPYDMWMIYE